MMLRSVAGTDLLSAHATPPAQSPCTHHTSRRWQARVLVGSLNADNPPLQLCELATLCTTRELDWYGPVAEVYDVAMERDTAVCARALCPSKHSNVLCLQSREKRRVRSIVVLQCEYE